MKAAAIPETFELDRVLSFLSELWALNHAIETASRRMQARVGVTAQQRMFVRVIGAFPRITPGQLARVVHLDPGTVSTAIGRLEDAGLVARREGSNGRSVSLELTARGRRLDAPDPHTIEGALARTLRRTPPGRATAVRSFIATFIRDLDAVSQGAPAATASTGTRSRRSVARRLQSAG